VFALLAKKCHPERWQSQREGPYVIYPVDAVDKVNQCADNLLHPGGRFCAVPIVRSLARLEAGFRMTEKRRAISPVSVLAAS